MTSRLLKKRPTIAPKFIRAIRTSIALSCLGAETIGLIGCPTVNAQIPVSQIAASHSTGTTLRPVAKFGTEHRQPIASNSTQPQGWNLRWRQSQHVRPLSTALATDRDVFADDSNERHAGTIHRVSSESDGRSYVSQAAHAAVFAPQVDELLQIPQGGSNNAAPSKDIDFFEDPFGLPKANTIPSPDELPSQAPQTLPSESRSIDALRNDLRSQPPSLQGSLRDGEAIEMPVPERTPSQSVPSLAPLDGPATAPQPVPDPVPESAPAPKSLFDDVAPSLPDLMRESDPTTPTPPRSSEELLPPPANRTDKEASSSDQDLFDNPFGRKDESEIDRLDRDRLRKMTEDESGSSANAMKAELDLPDNDTASTMGLSCQEFRDRISRQTIRDVSLDISPPFRPDVISEGEYQKLKSKFDDKQESRQWRSIDGRPLATGRLVDLAYEKAIIESDYGSKEEISINQLGEADLAFISQNWGLPAECLIEQVAYTPRTWTKATMTWKASNLCHKPLYFEEVNLERYGHTAGPVLQPIISSAHFFANIAVLPYKKGIHPPSECQYALGYYRPGDCAPWIVPPVPLSVRGAVRQAAVMTAGFWLIP